MAEVLIVGCGVVGAAIAYELSQVPQLSITVLDCQPPAQAATGAALGVLMAAISQKIKGRNLQMRLSSIQAYDAWVPHLEAVTGHKIPFNRQGILRLCFAEEDLEFWKVLTETRKAQGWAMEIYDRHRLWADYPQLSLERAIGAVYSPQDRQIDPTALTLALVAAATQNGVTFRFGSAAIAAEPHPPHCQFVQTTSGSYPVDWLVIAAGLGSTPLTASLQQPVDVRPVLGQALQVHLPQPLGHPHLQPVITGEDVHIVPLIAPLDGALSPTPDSYPYWIGATVEFPGATPEPVADAAMLEAVMQQAIALCPALAEGEIVRTWSGLRPRPEGRPAPIVELLSGYDNVLVATGHYRNGVLLAPATASMIRRAIVPEGDRS